MALVPTKPRVRRRRGAVVEVVPAGRCLLLLRRGVHGGCTPGGLVAIGLRLLDSPRPRGRRLLRRIVIGEGDQALDGGPPVFGLVCRWKEVEEQLRPCERFCWSGGERGRAARGAGYARTPNSVRRSRVPPRRLRFACARTVVRGVPRTSGLPLAQ